MIASARSSATVTGLPSLLARAVASRAIYLHHRRAGGQRDAGEGFGQRVGRVSGEIERLRGSL